MPAPNDLTPEEEAMFGEHGVASAGPGREPIGDDEPPAKIPSEPPAGEPPAGEPPAGEPPAGQAPVEPPVAEPKPGELGSRHRADGTFKSAEELEADRIALAGQQPPAGQPQGDQQPPQMVPLAALHEARSRVADFARQNQLLTTRMNAILMNQAPQGAQARPPLPNMAEDPAGYLLAVGERLEEFERERQEADFNRQIDTGLTNDEAQFSSMVSDYDAASDYYVESRARELLAFYTPEQAQQIMMKEARQIAQQSWQRGRSAAETVYSLAQARGYRRSETPPQQHQQFQPGPGAVPPTAQPPAQQGGPSAAATVAAIRAGQDASTSLSSGAGQSAAELNAEAVLKMSDAEFAKYFGLGSQGANDRFAQLG